MTPCRLHMTLRFTKGGVIYNSFKSNQVYLVTHDIYVHFITRDVTEEII